MLIYPRLPHQNAQQLRKIAEYVSATGSEGCLLCARTRQCCRGLGFMDVNDPRAAGAKTTSMTLGHFSSVSVDGGLRFFRIEPMPTPIR